MKRLATLLAVGLLAACATPTDGVGSAAPSAPAYGVGSAAPSAPAYGVVIAEPAPGVVIVEPVPPAPHVVPEPTGRYRLRAEVLENAEHGPQFCSGSNAMQPPDCRGPDLVGWTWDGLPHTTFGEIRWGQYTLVGTFDGQRFTLTEPARPITPADHEPPDLPSLPSTPCPAPAGGWPAADPARLSAAADRAETLPAFAGVWVDDTAPVLVVAFTDDPAAHVAALRQVWPGGLCLTRAARSYVELTRIMDEMAAAGVLTAGIDVVRNRVDVLRYTATPEEQRRLDATYGPGAVRLRGDLQPV